MMDGKSFAELTDMLVNMAVQGKKTDEYTLNMELKNLTSSISSILSELAEYKDMPDENYIDAAGRLQDQTFTMQLRKDISKLTSELKEHQRNLDELKEKENDIYNKLNVLTNSVSLAEKSIEAMQSRMATTQNEETKINYEQSIVQLQTKKKEEEQRLEHIKEEQNEIQSKIEAIRAQMDALEATKTMKETTLEGIEANLASEDAYIDKKRQQEDIARKEQLTKELDLLETKKSELVKDPVLLAKQAVEAYLEEDPTTARKICEEIATIATTKNPYLDEPNKDSLKEALVIVEEERNSFLTTMQGRTYESSDNNVLEGLRIGYLNRRITSNEQRISVLQTEISEIDSDQKYGTSIDITKVESIIAVEQEKLKKYEELLKKVDDEDFENKRALQAVYDRLQIRIESAQALSEKYTENRLMDLQRIDAINDEIKACEAQNEQYKREISEIGKEKVLNGAGAKDILAEREDKRTLDEKVETVKNIKASLNFAQTPTQILAQIDQTLGLVITPTEIPVKENVVEERPKQAPVTEEVKKEGVEPVLEPKAATEFVPSAEKKQPEVNANIAFQPAFGQAGKVNEQPVNTPVQGVAQQPSQSVTVNKEQIVNNLANTGSIPAQGDSKKKVTQTEEVAVQNKPVFEQVGEQPAQEKPMQMPRENQSIPNLSDFLNTIPNSTPSSNVTEFFQSGFEPEEEVRHKLGA